MADTTTTTTTTTVRTASFSCNLNYVTSPLGIFKLLELLFGLICWAIMASFTANGASGALQFSMFVFVTSWVLTLITLFIYLMALHATVCSGAPWQIMEFFFNAVWGLLYFIGACIIASYAPGHNPVAAATAFAFFTTTVYVIHTFFAYKAWKGAFPWQAVGSGGRSTGAADNA